eukprot:423919-Amphidinium_carterae.1
MFWVRALYCCSHRYSFEASSVRTVGRVVSMDQKGSRIDLPLNPVHELRKESQAPPTAIDAIGLIRTQIDHPNAVETRIVTSMFPFLGN